jgi:hypothetical protein
MLWEVAERQRRKSARETTASTSSIVVDVARRASALWTRRSSHHSVDGGGKHRVLQTSEDHVRLDDIVASPLHSAPPSPSPSPSPGPSPNHLPVTGPGPYARDPFADPLPGGSTSSLFVNALPTAEIDPGSAAVELQTPTSAGAPLLTSPPVVPPSGKRFSAKVVNAPAPLDLPKPRSPPPRTATPHAKRPPEPFPRPDSRMSRAAEEEEEDAKPVRWWTEWLCGCSEGPDRGGEVQVRSMAISLAPCLASFPPAPGWPDKPNGMIAPLVLSVLSPYDMRRCIPLP